MTSLSVPSQRRLNILGVRTNTILRLRAREMWVVDKELGLRWDGTDEETIEGYVNHLKRTHPDRYKAP